MIDEFGKQSNALVRLAMIFRGADTNRHDLMPEAARLLAASPGLSRICRDDLKHLEAGMLIYDAFHRWERDTTIEGRVRPSALIGQ